MCLGGNGVRVGSVSVRMGVFERGLTGMRWWVRCGSGWRECPRSRSRSRSRSCTPRPCSTWSHAAVPSLHAQLQVWRGR